MLEQNNANAKPGDVRKALLIDEDHDRYRRKERTTMLQNAGYKVFPVLRFEHAETRCKPGAFDLVVANAGENSTRALEFCEEMRRCNPKQKMFLVSNSNAAIGGQDYAVSNWDELMSKLGSGNQAQEAPKPESSLSAA
jgi:PleD family two-component response regulator